MRIAILMTNTDDSAFAHRWPLDGEKFTTMMRLVRPGWRYPVYAVKGGVFPETLDALDGALITGSPASVNCAADWVARLEALVREMVAAKRPVFGACFGHQVIAKALGGRVGNNPGGWVFGQIEARWSDGARMPVYASHSEQVLDLCGGAEVVADGPGCPVAGFAIADHVLTTQYHPEMEPEFMAALIDALQGDLPEGVCDAARASLSAPPDMRAWAARIAGFLERGGAR